MMDCDKGPLGIGREGPETILTIRQAVSLFNPYPGLLYD